MTEEEFQGWQTYYEAEPWGEDRADARQYGSECRWSHMLAGGTRKPPNAFWPYFENQSHLEPETIDKETAAFADAIEPKPGGGWQWKPEVLERLKREGKIKDGDDNRQTEFHG